MGDGRNVRSGSVNHPIVASELDDKDYEAFVEKFSVPFLSPLKATLEVGLIRIGTGDWHPFIRLTLDEPKKSFVVAQDENGTYIDLYLGDESKKISCGDWDMHKVAGGHIHYSPFEQETILAAVQHCEGPIQLRFHGLHAKVDNPENDILKTLQDFLNINTRSTFYFAGRSLGV